MVIAILYCVLSVVLPLLPVHGFQSDDLSDYDKILSWPEIKSPLSHHIVQSPADVDTRRAIPMSLSPLEWHQSKSIQNQELELINTGYYFEMALDKSIDKSQHPFIKGGPLFDDKYIFEQLHFHWGSDNLCGSEHSVDGYRFSIEVHIVFFKEEYKSFEDAKQYTDGVAVISFFGQLSEEDNPDLDNMIQKMKLIQEPKAKTTASFKDEFRFMDILLEQNEYISFPGSLTTPDYEECVTWIMFPNPFPISANQIDAFRQLKKADGQSMIRENDRELQEFGIRPIIYPWQHSTIELCSSSEEDPTHTNSNLASSASTHPSFVGDK